MDRTSVRYQTKRSEFGEGIQQHGIYYKPTKETKNLAMGLSSGVVLLITHMVSETVSLQQRNNVSTKTQSGNRVVLTLQLDDIKPKLASLEGKINNIELAIKHQEEQIKAMKRRKEFRCESGTLGYYKYPNQDWPYIKKVEFQSPFTHPPKVTYGLRFLDSVYDKNLRVDTKISNITNKGFHFIMKAWADTVLYGAYISWMACGY